MKLLAALLLCTSLFGGSAGCSQDQATIGESAIARDANASNKSRIPAANKTKSNTMKIKIGAKTFHATLFDNATSTAFKAMLPLTLDMDELNGNEKKHDFANSLPSASFHPKAINNGDLMLWGSNTLVLFYKSFATQYSYTKLGRIDNPLGLEAAVGSGNVTVTFEVD